jgi:hypothetical protein
LLLLWSRRFDGNEKSGQSGSNLIAFHQRRVGDSSTVYKRAVGAIQIVHRASRRTAKNQKMTARHFPIFRERPLSGIGSSDEQLLLGGDLDGLTGVRAGGASQAKSIHRKLGCAVSKIGGVKKGATSR